VQLFYQYRWPDLLLAGADGLHLRWERSWQFWVRRG